MVWSCFRANYLRILNSDKMNLSKILYLTPYYLKATRNCIASCICRITMAIQLLNFDVYIKTHAPVKYFGSRKS